MSCVMLDSNMYDMDEYLDMYNFLYFIMNNISLSSEESNENEINVERLNEHLDLFDVTSEKLIFSYFMSCNYENQTFLTTINKFN